MQEKFSELYYYLFNRITDALTALDAGDAKAARDILAEAQMVAEERYVSASEE